MIEHQQQQLRSAHPHMPPSANAHTTTSSHQSSATAQSQPITTTSSSTISKEAIYPRKLAPSSAASSSSKASNNNSNDDHAFIAPATPSLLMRLGQQGGKSNDKPSMATNNNATSKITAQHQPPSSAISSSSSSSVDNMASLPAAMLEMRPAPTRKQSLPATTTKRRRISRTSAAFTSPALAPTAMHMSPRVHPTTPSGTDPTIAALVSPAALRPQSSTASPRALKPLISPSLQPNGKRLTAIEEEVAAAALASKSNYQNMREGKAKSLGIEFSTSFQSGVENRRSAHKAAEQKRRDTLKQSFDALRKEIADALVEQQRQEEEEEVAKDDVQERRESKEKEVKQMSKVVLIQHSYEYILRLKEENRRKDQEMALLQQELDSLRKQINSSK